MKNIIFVFAFVLGIANLHAQKFYFINDDCIVRKGITAIDFLHITTTINKPKVETGETIGIIQKYPEILSEKYQNQVLKSQLLYSETNYKQASDILKEPYRNDSTNLFIADNYAKALYKIDSNKALAFQVYIKMIDQLSKQYEEMPNELKIDCWFREAYWKLATLYLDMQDYEKAIDLLIKFQLSISDMKGEPVYTQVLDYMTECAFYLKEYEIAKQYAKLTLKYDPHNKYVLDILKKIN
jgi:tetratricopeptide (TPR) repeat protein